MTYLPVSFRVATLTLFLWWQQCKSEGYGKNSQVLHHNYESPIWILGFALYIDSCILTHSSLVMTYLGRYVLISGLCPTFNSLRPSICVSKLTIIGSDNGLSPGRRQAIIWTNDGILLIGALGTIFSEILIEIQTFLFCKNHLKVSSAEWLPFCLGLNELIQHKYWALPHLLWCKNIGFCQLL